MNSYNNILYKVVWTFSISAFLLSCKVQQYNQPESEIPQAYRFAKKQKDTANIASINYKVFFKDPVLVSLIDKAILHNNDLKSAIKQIEFAELGYKQSKWQNIPSVNATLAGASLSRPSDNSMNGLMFSQFLGKSYIWDYNSTVSISWEADIWGKIKASKQEALTSYLETQEAAKAVQTKLISEVVIGYYNLLMLDKQLTVTQENLLFAEKTLSILKKQQELGMITSLAVQQQEITKDEILKSIPSIEIQIGTQENTLSILTGMLPDKIERGKGLEMVYIPEYISNGVPSELLSYRPDIKSRELAFKRSIASVNVAKTSMYPSLKITAQSGLNSFQASNWFNIPGSLFGAISGAIAQPILNGKQLKTRYKQAQITSEQAEINFKQSVLSAVGEVSNILLQIEKNEEQYVIAQGLVEKAEAAVNNSTVLYEYNGATYLEVILAQSNKLRAELDLTAIKSQKLSAITSLYRALGGGWKQ